MYSYAISISICDPQDKIVPFQLISQINLKENVWQSSWVTYDCNSAAIEKAVLKREGVRPSVPLRSATAVEWGYPTYHQKESPQHTGNRTVGPGSPKPTA